MRRLVVAAATGLTIVLVAFSLHTLSTAMLGDEAQTLPSTFASPIDPPSTIAGSVFGDTDGDGERHEGEPGIPDVLVKLANSVDETTTTDSEGNYSFTVGWADHYTVTAMTPAGYAATTTESHVVQVTGPNKAIEGIDFGYRFTLYLPLVARNYP